jgi:tRNA(Ser,Leu) C12 N-acetylase TAN1
MSKRKCKPRKTLRQANAKRKISSRELRRRVRANTLKLTGREVL